VFVPWFGAPRHGNRTPAQYLGWLTKPAFVFDVDSFAVAVKAEALPILSDLGRLFEGFSVFALARREFRGP
jgi:hypothetical protein